ncbi:MAG: preprotein translocase subunit SecE [Steroidobacteraceae bacterium]|nr:preprotein translocase subunit SecE [Steroidobacteraceae bacterium]MCW5571769.1 preprotein translocase subunit SecE [Steroidobacteraceae bacterium]
MNEAVKQSGAGTLDTAKLVTSVTLVLAGIVAFYALAAQPAYQRWLAMGGGVVLAAIVFATSTQGRELWQFTLDSRIELRKVFWPTREETLKVTGVVFVFVAVASLFFWVLDIVLAWLTRALTGQGS